MRNPARVQPRLTRPAQQARKKFLHYFPEGFEDETYLEWERNYKENAHLNWSRELSRTTFRSLLNQGTFGEIASRAVRIESRTNLLFSFEKMALRDALKSEEGARIFAHGLYELLYGRASDEKRFERWCEDVGSLPRRQTRVLTWPVVTVFPFIAQPERHCYLKPTVTRRAAEAYGAEFLYRSRPNWETYRSLLNFAEQVRNDQRDLKPKDMIDLQSFIWVQGSDEYPL